MVIAGLLIHKHKTLKAYVDSRLRTERPADIAMALMVTGFSECEEANHQLLRTWLRIQRYTKARSGIEPVYTGLQAVLLALESKTYEKTSAAPPEGRNLYF